MFSAKQCASKLTALKRMYKKIKNHNNTSDNDRQIWQYYDIFSKKPWLKSLSILNSTLIDDNSSSEASSKRLQKRKEAKMKRWNKMNELLEKLISQNENRN
ncbi:hypothetical protein P5V15_005900 [Pogonomyrmex californicus]